MHDGRNVPTLQEGMPPPRRSWTWLDASPYEGVALHVRVDHPRSTMEAWLRTRGPLPYDDHAALRYDDREEPTVFARHDVMEGRIELLRARCEGPEIEAFEASLIDALIDGALGPLVRLAVARSAFLRPMLLDVEADHRLAGASAPLAATPPSAKANQARSSCLSLRTR